MKLNEITRRRLRTAIRAFPTVAEFVECGIDIHSMDDTQMLALCERMGLNVFESTKPHPFDLNRAIRDRSESDPAFTGALRFTISIGVLGTTTHRTAEVTYRFTPDWRFIDRTTNRWRLGWESSAVRIGIKTQDERGNQEEVGNDLGKPGALTDEAWDRIYNAIEADARAQHEKRLLLLGLTS